MRNYIFRLLINYKFTISLSLEILLYLLVMNFFILFNYKQLEIHSNYKQ